MKNSLMIILLTCYFIPTSEATLINFTDCVGANQCNVITTPPNPILANPNNGLLLGWDERQNTLLTQDLSVDRVFDETVEFVKKTNTGTLFIKAGTIVSSHYFQWDPGLGSSNKVSATIHLDSQVFAFITSDNNLFSSDALLGLSGLDYADFRLRGLEKKDVTDFNASHVNILWKASKPGDWARLLTAYSPNASNALSQQIPEPNILMLFAISLLIAARVKHSY